MYYRVMPVKNLKRHRQNTQGVMLREISGQNAKDSTGLMVIVLKKIRTLLASKKHSDWEIGMNHFNKLLPYALPKQSYDQPLLQIGTKSDNGNTQVFIQLNNFMEDRQQRKAEITDFEELTSKEVVSDSMQ